jgi:hypothetical protein
VAGTSSIRRIEAQSSERPRDGSARSPIATDLVFDVSKTLPRAAIADRPR